MSEYEDFEELNDELDEEFETIVLTDEDGNEVSLTVVDALEHNGNTYLLVFNEAEYNEDNPEDSAEASILKEVAEEGDEVIYEFIDDDEELQDIIELFQRNNDDFEMEL